MVKGIGTGSRQLVWGLPSRKGPGATPRKASPCHANRMHALLFPQQARVRNMEGDAHFADSAPHAHVPRLFHGNMEQTRNVQNRHFRRRKPRFSVHRQGYLPLGNLERWWMVSNGALYLSVLNGLH